MLLVLQEPCEQCIGACHPGGIAITVQPFSKPQLLARSSIQNSSDSSLSEQCILFWGTLTTEGNFFFTRRKLGRRAIYKERMCSYSERCLKVPGTPGTKNHRWKGLTHRNILTRSPRGWKAEVEVWAELGLPLRHGGGLSRLPSWLLVAVYLGLHHASLHMGSPCVRVCLHFPLVPGCQS